MCRKLKADEIECRVATVSAKGCSLLLYKTARVDRAILDETYGKMKWQNDFKVIDGKMYGGIGIENDKGNWIWKWDCGTESNTEAEKGQASDCFKRAGFKWGIGVELYTAPFIFINVETIQDGKKYVLKDKYAKYHVVKIDYKDDDISVLSIADDKGNVVYELGKKQKTLPPKENKDEKIHQELIATTTTDEAHKIFKKYESQVENFEEFKQLYKQVYSKAKKKEGN